MVSFTKPMSLLVTPLLTLIALVPRAAGQEGPWAFAAGQISSERFNSSPPHHNPASPSRTSFSYSSSTSSFGTSSMRGSSSPPPSFLPTVPGPKTKKALGRSKALYDAGIDKLSSSPRPSESLSTTSARPSSSRNSQSKRRRSLLNFLDTDDNPSQEGRYLSLLKAFLLVSSDLAIAIGRSTTEPKQSSRPIISRGAGGRNGPGGREMFSTKGGAGIEDEEEFESDSEESVPNSDVDERPRPSSSRSQPLYAASQHRRKSSIVAPAPSYRLPPSLPSSRASSPPLTPGSRPPPKPDRSRVARPTRLWYALLAALLTQVVLEGFLTGGWTKGESVEMVFGVGCGGKRKRERKGVDSGGLRMGGIEKAGWMLFGERDGEKNKGMEREKRKGMRRREFEKEMEDRCSEVSFPSSIFLHCSDVKEVARA
jgi:hypothetical protein